MMCSGQWVAAPVPGYIAGAAWWDSPVGSEDEEKPLHIQAMATVNWVDMKSVIQHLHTTLENNGCQLDH